MRTSVLASILAFTFAISTWAGEFVPKGRYIPRPIVIGTALTARGAFEDAMTSVPEGLKPEPTSSQELDCTASEILFAENLDPICDLRIEGNLFRIIFPVVQE